jgi:hypothetical protein
LVIQHGLHQYPRTRARRLARLITFALSTEHQQYSPENQLEVVRESGEG